LSHKNKINIDFKEKDEKIANPLSMRNVDKNEKTYNWQDLIKKSENEINNKSEVKNNCPVSYRNKDDKRIENSSALVKN